MMIKELSKQYFFLSSSQLALSRLLEVMMVIEGNNGELVFVDNENAPGSL